MQFKEGENAASLKLNGEEIFDIAVLGGKLKPRQEISVTATASDGTKKSFKVIARLDSAVEVGYYQNGGILQTVLRQFAAQG